MKSIAEALYKYVKNGKIKCGIGVEESTIELAEHTMEVTFPDDLKQYLKAYGWITFGNIELFGLGENIPLHLNLVQNYKEETTQGDLPKDLIPFHNNGAGDLTCVRSVKENNSRSESKVVVYWHEDSAIEEQKEIFLSWIVDRIENNL